LFSRAENQKNVLITENGFVKTCFLRADRHLTVHKDKNQLFNYDKYGKHFSRFQKVNNI